MKKFENGKPIAIALLSLSVIYLFCFNLFPLIHDYYRLNIVYMNKAHRERSLEVRLSNLKRVKLVRFKAGYHRLSTDILTILSYINYLKKSGLDIEVRTNARVHKNNSSLNSKDIIISLKKIYNIGIVFSFLKTFNAFPIEIKRISLVSIKSMNAVMYVRLIGLVKERGAAK
ncbi:hypothetical protein ACMCNP_05920 [Candidatus Acidulodesulfobacterium sp. H_13]|uniref:hypothetical protein n=1 Tax=Candidatus Acidulodesulfobacterium sp. H_13 TaxID=3395470 RepID=UPI003AF4AAB3